MKLAEALLIRSDMQNKLAQLKGRIRKNVKVQEGDTPAEDPEKLLLEASQIITELNQLVAKIHRTNASTVLANGKPLLELLVERDSLNSRHRLLLDAIDATAQSDDRYSYREIKWDYTISIASIQKQADDIAMKIRELNLLIQANNWQIELLD